MSRRTRLQTAALALALGLLAACSTTGGSAPDNAGASNAANGFRRNSTQQNQDGLLEKRVSTRLSENFGDKVHVNAMAYKGVLLLTGEAPTPALKAEVETLVRLTPGLKELVNEVKVAPVSTTGARTSDSLLIAKLITRIGQSGAVDLADVKVQCEAGITYIMGSLTPTEARKTIEVARSTADVVKVISMLEIIPEPAAPSVTPPPPAAAQPPAAAPASRP